MSYENFAYYYDSLMDQSFYDDYLTFILKHADFHHVLELGCGTGEIAIRLAKLKKCVYASDLSEDMLEVARLKATDNDVCIQFSRVDMCDFEANDKIELVLCLCDSLNYVLDDGDVFKVFQNVFHCLKENGTFIFDVNSLYKMEEILKDYKEENDDDDFYFKWQVDKLGYGYVKHIVEIIDKLEDEHILEEHYQRTLSIEKYQDMLKKAGFNSIEIYSDFHEYHEKSERIIFVCRKEG